MSLQLAYRKTALVRILHHCNVVSTQSLGPELRTSDIQSSINKRSSSDVSAVCLKPRTALTSKCAALCAVQEFSVNPAWAIGLRNLSTAFSNLRYPLLRDCWAKPKLHSTNSLSSDEAFIASIGRTTPSSKARRSFSLGVLRVAAFSSISRIFSSTHCS